MPDTERRVLTPWGVLSAVTLSAVLAGAGYLGEWFVLGAVAVAAALVAYGWPKVLDLPSPRGVRAVLGFAAVVSCGATQVGDGPDLRWMPVGLAATLVAAFLHQLLRRDGRARLVATLGGTLLGAGVIAAGVCYVPVAEQPDGPLLLLAAALAVAISTALDFVGIGRRFAEWALPVSVGVSSGTVSVIAELVDGPVLGAFLTAVVACVGAHAVRRLLTVVPTASSARAQVTVGAGALLIAGPVPYAAMWLIEWYAAR